MPAPERPTYTPRLENLWAPPVSWKYGRHNNRVGKPLCFNGFQVALNLWKPAFWSPAGPAWDFEVTPWPPVDARVSLLFVEHHVVDSLALTVFSSLGGDPRLSVGRDHDVRRGSGLTTLLGHHFVGAGVDL